MASKRHRGLERTRRPRLISVLPGNIPLREPWAAESKFFKANLHISGLAADDDAVVLNPYAPLTARERESVALNEAARIFMRRHAFCRPDFSLTAEQERALGEYGPMQAKRETIAARLLSGDPSALTATQKQLEFVDRLALEMNVRKSSA